MPRINMVAYSLARDTNGQYERDKVLSNRVHDMQDGRTMREAFNEFCVEHWARYPMRPMQCSAHPIDKPYSPMDNELIYSLFTELNT